MLVSFFSAKVVRMQIMISILYELTVHVEQQAIRQRELHVRFGEENITQSAVKITDVTMIGVF